MQPQHPQMQPQAARETRLVEMVMNGPSLVRLGSNTTMSSGEGRHAERVWRGQHEINKLQAKQVTAQTQPSRIKRDTATQTAEAVTVDLTNSAA